MGTQDLDKLVNRISGLKHPPVHLWKPELIGELDMRIKRDGRWFYQGGEIKRQRLAALFASILRKEGDGYYLVTPVEKYRIQVDDVPFIAVELNQYEIHGVSALHFRTNMNDEIIADKDHPIRIEIDARTQEPAPYIRIRDEMDALMHRNVYYQLIELAQEKPDDSGSVLFITSMGFEFILGATS